MSEKRISWLILTCFTGIITGTVLANTAGLMKSDFLYIFAVDQYSAAGWLQQARKDLLFYLLRQRGIQFVFFCVLGFLGNPAIIVLLGVFFGGMIWGMILSLETIRLGIQGMLFAVSLFFPHSLLYIMAFGSFIRMRWKMEEQSQHIFSYGVKCIVLPLLFTIIGILAEGFVSPLLIQWVMRS